MKRIQIVSLRLVRERSIPYQTRMIHGAKMVYEVFRELAEDLDREAMWVMCLDTKNQVTCLSQVSLGTLNSAPASPKEIVKTALMANSMSIILLHNHPSGDPEPSSDDRKVTAQIKAAAQLMDIKVLDHLIVGDGSYYSFAEQGVL